MQVCPKPLSYLVMGVVMLGIVSCGGGNQASTAQTKEPAKDTTTAKVPPAKPKETLTDRKFNDIARFVAGLPAEEGSTIAKYHDTDAWKQYAKANDAQWTGLNQRKVAKMQQWANEELKAVNERKGLLFYPFGGADALHASIFFPEIEETVMIGLEPIGNMPDLDNVAKKGALGGYLGGVRRSLVTILEYSFFKTNDMAVDFTGRVAYDLDGTLPVLLFFLARTNHKILYYEKVAINPEGKLVSAADFKGDKQTYYGTKISYQRADKPEERKTLYYFSCNLSNDPYNGQGGLNQRKDLMQYLESLPISVTYLKSASYLMYKSYFFKVRDLILAKSGYLLQDDSGMPLVNFTNGKWDLTFFGVYAGPIGLFSNYWQPDMKQAFAKKEQVRPLPFGIGYQFREGTSNLMLAKKK